MEKICKECGGKIPENSNFCPECGKSMETKKIKKFCPNCAAYLDGKVICPECCKNTLEKEPYFLSKYKLPLIAVLILGIILVATVILTDDEYYEPVGSQITSIDGIDFEIPEYYEHNAEEDKVITDRGITTTTKTFESDDGIIIIDVMKSHDTEPITDLYSPKGNKTVLLGQEGYLEKLDGGIYSFSFEYDDKECNVYVSDEYIFDEIGVVENIW